MSAFLLKLNIHLFKQLRTKASFLLSFKFLLDSFHYFKMPLTHTHTKKKKRTSIYSPIWIKYKIRELNVNT